MVVDHYIHNRLGREKANFLTKDSTSLCIKVTKKEDLTISPVYIGSICEGITKQLESRINQYDPELKGTILAYEDLNLISSDASLKDERPFLFLKIKVTYILFQPQIGKILTGIIKEIKKSHVVCVVHEMFNATIFQSPSATWNVSTLKPGDHLPFEVTEISQNTKLFFLKGKLASLPVCQSSTFSEPTENHTDLIKKKKIETSNVMTQSAAEPEPKKGKQKTSINLDISQEHQTKLVPEENIEILNSSSKKKKKKRKHSDDME